VSINFDVHIGSESNSVDMKSGLQTLQGASDSLRTITETALTGSVPKRHNAKSAIRTNLKKSFSGSWGQIFSLDLYEDELKSKLQQIGGSSVLVEIVEHFLDEAVYRDFSNMSPKARAVLDQIQNVSDDLVLKLRQSPLRQLHKVATDFEFAVTLRHRASREHVRAIGKFDQESAEAISGSAGAEVYEFEASVTRLNIFTGNGRLKLVGGEETIAFGFAQPYREVSKAVKRRLSQNLDSNNKLDPAEWEPVVFRARAVALRSSKVVKYLVTSVR